MENFLTVRGIRLHYLVQGKGTPVVLLHGLTSSIAMNWRLPGILEELAKEHQVIALDFPGHGSSDKPTQPAAYGMQMVDDVLALLDQVKVPKAHLVGYSMGGMVALKFLARYPTRVLSGVLCGMGWLQEGSALQRFWGRMPGHEGSNTPLACPRSCGALALTEKELKGIHVPLTAIVGEQDPVRRLYVEPLHRVRPDIPVIAIPGAGHINCIIQPQFHTALARSLRTTK
ncbi:MAG: alpha/beta hydrolase [Armatimonas sp.]